MHNTYRSVSAFRPKPDCPLTCKQTLVYSYLAYQDEYTFTKTNRGVASYLCFSEHGVGDIVRQLAEHGAYTDRVVSRPDWFHEFPKSTGHWRRGYQFWRWLVRAPGSPLSFSETVVLSYIWHFVGGSYSPRWTPRYISNGTGLSEKMAGEALDALVSGSYIERDGPTIHPYELDPADLDRLFVRKGTPTAPSSEPMTVKKRATLNDNSNTVTIHPHITEGATNAREEPQLTGQQILDYIYRHELNPHKGNLSAFRTWSATILGNTRFRPDDWKRVVDAMLMENASAACPSDVATAV